MAHLLFVAYLFLFAWLITKTKFFTRTGLSNSQLVMLFLLKVMAGIFYGWIGTYYGNLATMVDTLLYHRYGVKEYELLFSNPHEYFTNLFHNSYVNGGDFFGSYNSYWNDLKSNVFIKMLSIFDIFSFGHYYVNVIFFSFISLIGPISLYRVMTDLFPGRKIAVLIATFLIPSFLYWSSGIHKEGLLFMAISLIIYHLYFGWKEGHYSFKRWLVIILCLFILLVLRNFLLPLIIPAVLSWMLAIRKPRYGLAIFAGVYVFFGVLFFTAKYIHPKLDFPLAVVNKQKAFLQLQGGFSTIPVKELEPTASSFLKNLPQAITLSFLRPYPADVVHLLSLAASAEIVCMLLVFVLFLFFRKRNGPVSRTAIYLCIFLSASMMLAIGFSINNLGAIVRYRSIILPLMVIPMVAQTDWKRIGDYFAGKSRNPQPGQTT